MRRPPDTLVMLDVVLYVRDMSACERFLCGAAGHARVVAARC
jgi:hypothetical protein